MALVVLVVVAKVVVVDLVVSGKGNRTEFNKFSLNSSLCKIGAFVEARSLSLCKIKESEFSVGSISSDSGSASYSKLSSSSS